MNEWQQPYVAAETVPVETFPRRWAVGRVRPSVDVDGRIDIDQAIVDAGTAEEAARIGSMPGWEVRWARLLPDRGEEDTVRRIVEDAFRTAAKIREMDNDYLNDVDELDSHRLAEIIVSLAERLATVAGIEQSAVWVPGAILDMVDF